MHRKLLITICAALLLAALAAAALPRQPKLVAITFDDGPHREFTPLVAEALHERGAKATFFMVGSWVGQKEELVRQLAADGHQIANHSWAHANFTDMTAEDIRADVERSRARLEEVTGQRDFLVRTPFGVRTEAALEAIDSPLILWSQDPAEGQLVSGPEMAAKVIRNIHDGDIILLHDSTQDNLDAACLIIDALQKKGYEFVTVDELFAARGVTPEKGVIYKSLPPR